jgi:hypothetical protein
MLYEQMAARVLKDEKHFDIPESFRIDIIIVHHVISEVQMSNHAGK